MDSKAFVIISTDKFPDADAGAVRTHSFAKILYNLGYAPVIIGLGKYTGFNYNELDGLKYCSLRFKNSSCVFRLLTRLLFPLLAKRELSKLIPYQIGGILLVAENKTLIRFIRGISLKYNIPVLFDSVEWFSLSEFNNHKNNYFYKNNDDIIRKYITSPIKVISISTYLENFYIKRNIITTRIPAILNVNEIPYSVDSVNRNSVNIVYAGMPGKKDCLIELVTAVIGLDNVSKARLSIRIIGIDKDTFTRYMFKADSSIPDCFKFEGRQSRQYVLEALYDADFAFLLRPSHERYAKAGFPTKVAESCSCGTAMLCNYSSDLELYLKDEFNSIIISECNPDSCREALLKILNMSNAQINKMKENARLTAESYFNYKNYIEQFGVFINCNYTA